MLSPPGRVPDNSAGVPALQGREAPARSVPLVPDDTETLEEFFPDLAEQLGWTSDTTMLNMALWNTACTHAWDATTPVESASNPARRSMEDLDVLLELDPRMVVLYRLSVVCGALADELTAAMDERRVGFSSGVVSLESLFPARLDELREMAKAGDTETALDLAAELIGEGLLHRNEALVHTAVLEIAFNAEFPVSFVDAPPSFAAVYLNLGRGTSAFLMCRHYGGCRGENTPFVLRQCVIKAKERGAFCHRPENLERVIYQTLTPIEFPAFRSLVDLLTPVI